MTKNNIRKPNNKNLEDLKKTLKKTNDKFDEIENIGLKYQEKGEKLVKYARMGKECINFQSEEAPKLYTASLDFPTFNNTLTNWNISGNIYYNNLEKAQNQLVRGLQFIDQGTSVVTLNTTRIAANISIASSEVNKISLDEESLDVYEKYSFQKPELLEHITLQQELEYELSLINTRLVNKWKGAWYAFNSASPDKKAQSANSMRNIMNGLIEMWASNDDVKKADWWIEEKDTKSGVSKRQRLKYLLFGPKNVEDIDILNSLDDQTSKINENIDLLLKTAHGSDQELELLESTIKLIEVTILSILLYQKDQK